MTLRHFLFFILPGLTACQHNEKEQIHKDALNAVSIDKLKIKTLDNSPIHTREFKNKTVFVNFWATWCKPCIQEMPSIEKTSILRKDHPIVFLMATDQDVEGIIAFRKQHPFSMRFVQSGSNEALQPDFLPTTYIFNPAAQLVFTESGFRDWNKKGSIDLLLKIVNNDE